MRSNTNHMTYDRALKSLMGDHAAEILPELLPNAQFIQEENSEITQLNIRADLVCRIMYNDRRCILNMKLQTNADEDLIKHLRRFRTILHRSKTLSEQDKQIVEAKMESYDSLLESDPEIQEMQIKRQQKILLVFVEALFPNLVELANQQSSRLTNPDGVEKLAQLIARAPDEKTARRIIETLAA